MQSFPIFNKTLKLVLLKTNQGKVDLVDFIQSSRSTPFCLVGQGRFNFFAQIFCRIKEDGIHLHALEEKNIFLLG